MCGQPEALARLGGQQQLLHRPGLAGGGIAALVRRRESVEQLVVSGVDGDQLPLQVGGQLGDLQAVSGQHAGEVVAVRLALRGLGQVEQVRRAGRHLYAAVSQTRGPRGQRVQAIEGRCVADELRQEQRRTLERLQRDSPRCNRLHLS